MNPEHDRNLRVNVAILELLQTFLRDSNVEVQTPELIVAWCWIICSSANEDFTLLLDTTRAKLGGIEWTCKRVLYFAVGPPLVDRRVGNTTKVSKTVNVVIFATDLTPQGWEILCNLHFRLDMRREILLLGK